MAWGLLSHDEVESIFRKSLLVLGAGACAVTSINEASAAPDGVRFCRDALARWQARPAAEKRQHRPCVVFDVDNTLVDKRPTTRGAALRFGRAFGLKSLASLSSHQMGWDGLGTANRAGLDAATRGRFQRYWSAFFWNPRRFVKLDRPIDKTIALAHAAKAAGCEVYYLTGRYDTLKPATIAQLAKHGLPDADARHVRCKPQGMDTGSFKITEMKRIQRRGPVLWFASDAHSDIAAIQRANKIPCLLVDFPVKPPTLPRIDPRTPTIKIRP